VPEPVCVPVPELISLFLIFGKGKDQLIRARARTRARARRIFLHKRLLLLFIGVFAGFA